MNLFQRLAIVTVALTYFLVGVGAFVRVSGAGMGCPDWPMCFGLLIPPTSAAGLPAGYDPAQFDVVRTWTEYLNRLLGVLVGFSIFATLVCAVVTQRKNAAVLWPTVGAFLGVGYAGWLGARVVAHNLKPWIVTVHLAAALAVVALLLFATVNAFARTAAPQRQTFIASLAALVVVLLQAGLGTQVRGTVEDVARAQPGLARGEWLAHVGPLDIAHRTLALVVVAACVFAFVVARKHGDRVARVACAIAAVASVAQLLGGFGLANAALPAVLQLLHVEVFVVVFGALVVALTWTRAARQ